MADPVAAEEPDEAQVSRSRLARIVYGALGFLFLGLGILGILVPGLPTTINIILAAFFFFRSNGRMYAWLINHRVFGPALRDYRAGLGIPRKAKIWAVSAVVVTFAITLTFAITAFWWRVGMIGLALAICTYILTRPTKETVLAARAATKASPAPDGV